MLLQLTIVFLLVLLSGFFSACEISLFGLTPTKLKVMVEKKEKNSDVISKLLKDKENLLSAILLGNNIANISATSLATVAFVGMFKNFGSDLGPLVSTIVMTILLLIFGAVLPKTIASQKPEQVAKIIAKPLFMITTVIKPLSVTITKLLKKLTKPFTSEQISVISEEEVKAMAAMSSESGGINEDQSKFINDIFKLSKVRVREAMTHADDMVSIRINATIKDIRKMMDRGYSHLPVFDMENEKIEGILHVRQLVYDDNLDTLKLEKVISEPFYVPDTMVIHELLKLFQKEHLLFAVVMNEFGKVVGVITLEDIIEQIIGDIHDAYDEVHRLIIPLQHDDYIVFGKLKLSKFNEEFGTSLTSESVTTIAGYVQEIIGSLPEEKQQIDIEHLKVEVKKIVDNRISKLYIKVLPIVDEDETEDIDVENID